MLLSVFTPTHHPTYLLDAYHSLLRQSHREWEWVLVPSENEGRLIPEEIMRDKRVRVLSGFLGEKRIGALKRAACDQAYGDVFIELDHDDILMPGETLRAVAEKAQAGAGFIYSDTAVFKENLTPHTWSQHYGWEHYPVQVYGRTLQAARCFPIAPRALCEIYFCPDHLRAWSRRAYFAAGGHDRNLFVGDDHDLLCRTYLSHADFVHTGGCHYLYRFHTQNTIHTRDKEIREQTAANRRRYTGPMIREWCRRENLPILELKAPLPEQWSWNLPVIETHLLDRSLERARGHYGLISLDDVFQFCPQPLITPLMNLFYEILVPGGYLEIQVPNASSRAGYLDPDAPSRFNEASFLNYSRKTFADRRPGITCHFQEVDLHSSAPSDFHRSRGVEYLTVHLMALKGGRAAGLKHI